MCLSNAVATAVVVTFAAEAIVIVGEELLLLPCVIAIPRH